MMTSVALFAATPAFAQGTAPTTNPAFTGPRIEARVGFDQFDTDIESDGEEVSVDGFDGIAYGGEVGFDAAFGGALIGAYAGGELSDAGSCSELFGEDELCAEVNRTFTVGARVGFVAADSALLYLKGGYSNTRFRASYEDFEDIIDDTSDSASEGGYHLGGGVEGALTSNIYVRAEYVYTQYSENDDEDLDISSSLNRDQFFLGLGFRF